jgi:hypothetical protein
MIFTAPVVAYARQMVSYCRFGTPEKDYQHKEKLA